MAPGVGNQTITLAVLGMGAAEITEMFLKAGLVAAISGGTRTGNGDIVKASLVNGTVYQAWLQGKTASNFYGIGSGSIFLVPLAGAQTGSGPGKNVSATRPISRILEKVNAVLTGSANLLAWIQTFDVGESINGHLFLGYHPDQVKKQITKGPVVYVVPRTLTADDSESETTFRFELTVSVLFTWGFDHTEQATFIGEFNFIDLIINEFAALGLNSIGGQNVNLKRLGFPRMLDRDPNNPQIRVAEMNLVWNMGLER